MRIEIVCIGMNLINPNPESMKTLLIAYYWYPWNNSGTFRWTGFGRHIDFDVLTCKKPLRSKKDFGIKTRNYYDRVYKFGMYLPAIVWGFIAPFIALFKRYDVYVITAPPESLLIGAWILQKFGKTVIVDLRDSIDREKQYFKRLIPVYKFFLNKTKNRVVAYKFLDESATVIYTGYEPFTPTPFRGFYSERVSYSWFIHKLSMGYMPTQKYKPKGYGSGSSQTYRHLGFPLDNNFHPEVYNHELISIEDSAFKLLRFIKTIYDDRAIKRNSRYCWYADIYRNIMRGNYFK